MDWCIQNTADLVQRCDESVDGGAYFFHARGANGEFSPANILLDELEGAILHIGYILLLDRFDEVDGEFGTVMARFLRDVQERGIKTSIDAVSDSTADYPGKLIPALKYSNYAIMNEIESCNIWGLSPRGEDGRLNIPNIRVAMEKMVEAGVKDKAIIHAKEAGFCLNAATGAFTAVGSLRIPSGKIKGSVGAGDAFCAGCLYGIYEGLEDREILELASGAAACSLLSENSVDGMRPKKEILKLMQQYGRLEV